MFVLNFKNAFRGNKGLFLIFQFLRTQRQRSKENAKADVMCNRSLHITSAFAGPLGVWIFKGRQIPTHLLPDPYLHTYPAVYRVLVAAHPCSYCPVQPGDIAPSVLPDHFLPSRLELLRATAYAAKINLPAFGCQQISLFFYLRPTMHRRQSLRVHSYQSERESDTTCNGCLDFFKEFFRFR